MFTESLTTVTDPEFYRKLQSACFTYTVKPRFMATFFYPGETPMFIFL